MARRKLAAAVVTIPPSPASVAMMENLDDIAGWLGTFRERLTLARETERPGYEELLQRLERRYRERRGELA